MLMVAGCGLRPARQREFHVPSEKTVELAGFALAHAALSVSEGETLIPMALVDNGGDNRLIRFEGPTDKSVPLARTRLLDMKPPPDRWILVYDAVSRRGGHRNDCLVLQTWDPKGPLVRIVQEYDAKGPGQVFQIRTAPSFIDEGGNEVGTPELRAWLRTGVMSHDKAAPLFHEWPGLR